MYWVINYIPNELSINIVNMRNTETEVEEKQVGELETLDSK